MKKENSIINVEWNITGTTLNQKEKVDLNDITKENVCGIYKITNKINNKYYVGSSKNICGKRGRWFWHLHKLNKNKHINKKLQNSWNKYGKSNWLFSIMETVEESKLSEVEQIYLDICKTHPEENYNIAYDVSRPMIGYTHSEDVKIKMRERVLGSKNPGYGKKLSEEHKEKLKEAIKEKSSGINHYMFGKSLSSEIKNKISISNTGKLRSTETKEKMSKSLMGRVFSDVHKLNLKNNRSDFKGPNHPKYNKTIYNFINKKTNEIFNGTRHEFMKKFNIPSGRCSRLVNGQIKTLKKWELQPT